jgi:hypothetical protein
MKRGRLVFLGCLLLFASFAVTLLVLHQASEPRPVNVNSKFFYAGATGERLTGSLEVDAHLIGTFDYEGDCGPIGPHAVPCQGPGTLQLAVSLLNTGSSPEVVPVFEARCDAEHAASGTAPAFATGDAIPPGVRLTDTVTFDLTGHRCPAPVALVYRVHARDGDPAIAVPAPLPI